MSSIEHERNVLEETAGQLSLEEKARLDEAIKQAELFLNGSGSVVAENECLDNAAAAKLGATAIVVKGVLLNTSNGSLTTETNLQHQYAGKVTMDYNETIGSGSKGSGFFTMKASDKEGVEAAVVYFGQDNSRTKDCAWLLGFRINQIYTNVYVVCGSKDEYMNLNWAEIKHKIEIGGDHDGLYRNPDTGTSISASIGRRNNGEYFVLAYLNGEY